MLSIGRMHFWNSELFSAKNRMDYKLNLSVYSKYRTQIMGISALMIIICHVQGIDFFAFSYSCEAYLVWKLWSGIFLVCKWLWNVLLNR